MTHTKVCQTEQMPFLHRNSFLIVLQRANRGFIAVFSFEVSENFGIRGTA